MCCHSHRQDLGEQPQVQKLVRDQNWDCSPGSFSKRDITHSNTCSKYQTFQMPSHYCGSCKIPGGCQTCNACLSRLAPLGPGITSCISSAGGGTEALSRGSHSLGHKPYLLSSVGKAAGSQPSGATPTQVGPDSIGCQHVLSRNSKEETTLKCVRCQTQPKHNHTLAFGTALQAQCQCLAKLR